MAIFDFKCKTCERIVEDVVLSVNHAPGDVPMCCDAFMSKHFTSVPMVHWKDYDLPDGGFRATHDGTLITSRKQNREYMARNGLRDANETFEPPTQEQQKEEHQQALDSINAITPTESQMHQLKADGVIDGEGQIITGE